MQTAINHTSDALFHREHALRQMPVIALPAARKLPATRQDITRYVELLLTPDEQRACDMATD